MVSFVPQMFAIILSAAVTVKNALCFATTYATLIAKIVLTEC